MHIGILQAGHLPAEIIARLGDYDALYRRMLEGQGLTFTTWNVVDMEFPNSVHAAEGWLISGSKHAIYEDHPWIPPLIQLIQGAFVAKVPMVGICFGHQAIAQAMGGQVEKFDKGWSVGLQGYQIGGEDYALNAWHQDQVVGKPDLATRIGSNGFCENAALLYGRQALSVQPHPEFEDDSMERLIQYRGPGVVPEDRLGYAQSMLGRGNDNARMAQLIGDFFRSARTEEAA